MPDSPAKTRDPLADRLDRLLADLHAAYARLDEIADARARAVSTADTTGIARAIADENEIVQRLASLDAERASIVRDAAQRPSAIFADRTTLDPATTTITDLVRLIDEPISPVRATLFDAAGALRRLIERVQAKNAATRLAAEKLAKHMQGLIRAAEG